MNEKNLLKRIEINPDVMLGKPVIKGTRLPVEIIVEKIAYGESHENILAAYPFLSEKDIQAAILFAAKSLSREEIYSI